MSPKDKAPKPVSFHPQGQQTPPPGSIAPAGQQWQQPQNGAPQGHGTPQQPQEPQPQPQQPQQPQPQLSYPQQQQSQHPQPQLSYPQQQQSQQPQFQTPPQGQVPPAQKPKKKRRLGLWLGLGIPLVAILIIAAMVLIGMARAGMFVSEGEPPKDFAPVDGRGFLDDRYAEGYREVTIPVKNGADKDVLGLSQDGATLAFFQESQNLDGPNQLLYLDVATGDMTGSVPVENCTNVTDRSSLFCTLPPKVEGNTTIMTLAEFGLSEESPMYTIDITEGLKAKATGQLDWLGTNEKGEDILHLTGGAYSNVITEPVLAIKDEVVQWGKYFDEDTGRGSRECALVLSKSRIACAVQTPGDTPVSVQDAANGEIVSAFMAKSPQFAEDGIIVSTRDIESEGGISRDGSGNDDPMYEVLDYEGEPIDFKTINPNRDDAGASDLIPRNTRGTFDVMYSLEALLWGKQLNRYVLDADGNIVARQDWKVKMTGPIGGDKIFTNQESGDEIFRGEALGVTANGKAVYWSHMSGAVTDAEFVDSATGKTLTEVTSDGKGHIEIKHGILRYQDHSAYEVTVLLPGK